MKHFVTMHFEKKPFKTIKLLLTIIIIAQFYLNWMTPISVMVVLLYYFVTEITTIQVTNRFTIQIKYFITALEKPSDVFLSLLHN